MMPELLLVRVSEEPKDCKTEAIPVNSVADTPLACIAAKIAPERTGGIVSKSHPCINCEAWVIERDWRSNSCCNNCGQRLGLVWDGSGFVMKSGAYINHCSVYRIF